MKKQDLETIVRVLFGPTKNILRKAGRPYNAMFVDQAADLLIQQKYKIDAIKARKNIKENMQIMDKALELADEIERHLSRSIDLRFETAKTLRQQQDKIAQLKHMNRNWQISEYQLQVEIDALKSNYESMAQTNIAMGKRLLELNEEIAILQTTLQKI